MLSEHSTRAIGLELDFRLISHFAPFSPTRSVFLCFFFALFSLSLFEIFFPQNEKCMRFPRVRFPQLSETYSVPHSVKKKQVKWRKKERERGRERLEKEIRICATQSNGWQQNRREDGGLADGGIWELWDSEREQEGERERKWKGGIKTSS